MPDEVFMIVTSWCGSSQVYCGKSCARLRGNLTSPLLVDTYRPGDIEKLGVRNSTDLLIKLPQEMGTTATRIGPMSVTAASYPNLHGLLPKEALVLIDGKRAAIAGGGGFWGEVLP